MRHTRWALACTILFVAIAYGCSSGGTVKAKGPALAEDVQEEEDSREGDVRIQVDLAEITPDTLTFDGLDKISPPDGLEPLCDEAPYSFGCSCAGNDDCESGYCVDSSNGFVCTSECVEDCPVDWLCKGFSGFGADIVFLCVPEAEKMCTPCAQDLDCGIGVCATFGDGDFCSLSCDEDKPCPDLFDCVAAEDGDESICVPASGRCDCTEEQEGATRPCVLENEFGLCTGKETCDPAAGWAGCDAQEPAEETCDGLDNDCDGSFDEELPKTIACSNTIDGVGTCDGTALCLGLDGWLCDAASPLTEVCDFQDNDCDGEVDEDFKLDGKYADQNHCGTCNQDCTGAILHASAVCDASGDTPLCVVEGCDVGYYEFNQFQCLTQGQTLCKPCTSDLGCEGGTCVDYSGGQFCAQDCSDEACPPSFSCGTVEGNAGKWCLPVSGTCDCSKDNSGATRPCSLGNDVGVCFGYETCDPEVGWVGCTAPQAAVEICDGLDNDCNGTPDDGLANGAPCELSEAGIGTCTGVDLCLGAQGWACSAAKPEPEVCDFKDNDCDGDVDEDYKVDGVYGVYEHCGSCNKGCEGAVPNAQAYCDLEGVTPQCLVEQCLDGFFQLNEAQCILPPDVQCGPCDSNADCFFGSCVDLEGKSYCLTPCGELDACDPGHECMDNDGLGPLCWPETLSCQCDDESVGQQATCNWQNEWGICYGLKTCQNSGWSSCDSPQPAEEICDGIDNDCNGLVDDGLPVTKPCQKSNAFGTCEGLSTCNGPVGWVCLAPVPFAEVCDYEDNDCDGDVDELFIDGAKYVDDDHCGVCNNSCGQAFLNASGKCDPTYLIPKCIVDECNDGYFQLSNFQCIVPPYTTCQSCLVDEDCLGGHCVDIDGAMKCASECNASEDCTGAADGCFSYPGKGNLCQPVSGSCECNEENGGAKRSCFVDNETGTCFGFQTCIPNVGWGACDAPEAALEECNGVDDDCNGFIDDGLPDTIACENSNEWGVCTGAAVCSGTVGWACQAQVPEPEKCDYQDNDCDGEVDELFMIDGFYVDIEHCGSCNKSCIEALPHAEAFCDGTAQPPVCKVDTCDDGFFPLNEFQCILPPDVQCKECVDDSECYFDSCVPLDQGDFCLSTCMDGACAPGFQCEEIAEVGQFCVPETASCDCNEANEGKKRSCSVDNALGSCLGVETCLADSGWSQCDAPIPALEECDGIDNDCDGQIDEDLPDAVPCENSNEWGTCAGMSICLGVAGWVCQATYAAPESCDYQDNDCDGDVDEGFQSEGKYTTLNHCGSCNKSCDGALPNALAFCDGDDSPPKCKVESCDDVFFQLNEFQCILPPDVQCKDCSTDDDCYFGRCALLDQGTFCFDLCTEVGCGQGFHCEDLPAVGEVCVPDSGSCDCSAENAGKKRSCSRDNIFGLCLGFETCQADSGWSECDAMEPAAEICDGVDNDCDGAIDEDQPATLPCFESNEFGVCTGVEICLGQAGWVCQAPIPEAEACDFQDNDCDGEIDEDFRVGAKYVEDEHCGTCNNACLNAIPDAAGICDPDFAVPKCIVESCQNGFFKLSPFQCVVPPNTTCQACATDADCLGSFCVDIDGQQRCAFPCESNDDCTEETLCQPFGDLGLLCQPTSGSCECNSDSDDAKRSCFAENEVGLCFGFETCNPDQGWGECDALTPAPEMCDGIDNDCNGLVDDALPPTQDCEAENQFGTCEGIAICMGQAGWICQAPQPSAEVCDYQDNNCDGAVDEGFAEDGVYNTFEHCGSCNKSCDGALQNAVALCDSQSNPPVCKVESCADGFFQLNDFQCIEPPDVACTLCDSDDDCYFDKCIPLDQGSYCLAQCEEGQCDDGYQCESLPGDGAICVPTTSSCECNESNAGTTRSCSQSNVIGTCFGIESCDAELGWIGCNALVPADEECDGVDNDCNGLVDDALPEGEACAVTNNFGSCAGVSVCFGDEGWVCQAPEPAAETCDYQDNDCDGQIDEDFRDGEKYVEDEHCGTCNNGCVDAIENATGVCDAGFPLPRCVVESCDDGFYQASQFQCVVPPDTTCQACDSSADCFGAPCVQLDGKMRCAIACEVDEDCSGENECEPYAGEDDLCQPVSGSCECTSFTDGAKRSCSRANAIGTCFGFETCDAEDGWSSCDALVPADEVCDGIDNDCNGLIDDDLPDSQPCSVENEFGSCDGAALCLGQAGWVCQAQEPGAELCDYADNDCDGDVDEGFKDANGEYTGFFNCGSCTISCEAGFPNAMATCDSDKDPPQCVVAECDEGYFKLNEFQCIPDTASLCEPCSTDDNCVLDGAQCVQLSDGKFCSKECVNNTECPAGYTCQPYGGGKQCIPVTNSCGCDGSNTDLSKSCSATWPPEPAQGEPFTQCFGNQFCTVNGWSDCVLPGEVCDGIDNDCNGAIDDGFLVGGKYVLDTNCGQCGNNCTFLQFPNANGVCDISTPVPDCAMECQPGFFDVNLNPADGCECQFASEIDTPDGLDQNCDGVDGELDNGIFVAKNGSDFNPGTMDEPMLTVQGALDSAFAAGLRDVYVATGVYMQSLSLRQGVRVYGGYSSDFLQRNILLYETVLMGEPYSPQLPGVVNAVSITGQAGSTRLDGFTIFGRNNNNEGGSSYAAYVRDCSEAVSLSSNRIVAGNGGNGSGGQPGLDGTDGTSGAAGSSAFAYGSNNCNAGEVSGGGSGGARFCGGANASGGAGGDSYCPVFSSPNAGEYGVDGSGPGGVGGDAGWDGRFTSSCGLCTVPTSNNPSEGEDGAKGANGDLGDSGDGCAAASGQVVNGLWSSVDGGPGGEGADGDGGGGGGSGGGADVTQSYLNCNDQIGGTGGGGGSGACSGTGGTAGSGGGASFGLFVFFSAPPVSLPSLAGNLVEAGIGGAGGAGGAGGTGGVGGTGATGGAPGTGAAWCAHGGGTGGDGGTGGHGGGGGGGCGGVSYCVFVDGQGGADLSGYGPGAVTCNAGSGGPGGSGGPSVGSAGDAGLSGASAGTNF